MRLSSALLAASLLLGAVPAIAAPYAPPAIQIGQAFKEGGAWVPAGGAVASPADRWWEMFGDPTLSGLEARIESANPSLAAAAARYTEASAALARARGGFWPSIGVGGAAERNRLSAGRPQANNSVTYNDASVGASLSYELDLFGRIRGQSRQARALAEAAGHDLAAVRLGLQMQLAAAYFELRGLDARAELLDVTVEAYQRAFDLTSTRHDGGLASGVEVAQAQSQLSTARAEVEAVAARRAEAEHAVAILIGEVPGVFSLAASSLQPPAPAVPVSLPSAVLERRPDIQAAERRVAAANAAIGVARTAYFPSITLGAAAGFQTSHGELLTTPNRYWALGPLSAAAILFDGGRRRAGVRISQAQYDEAAADYRQTVLTAFGEVEDDLVSARRMAAQITHQTTATEAARRAEEIALDRYRDGAADYVEVVTAQTASLAAQSALIELRTRQLILAADLVRAQGGLTPAADPAP
ncbi:efflux transporter outer membrane subunit [Caulobacter segnis]|uniref:efflux transporter outer membrane subunit n=1 Tax=Caulobacter segnis TaxID=88688 RepID=UPI00241090BE|nr:efflux transporter outer membrane subunit [Caulobacter segnis]MDG2522117.1 efflux transporter outer membrane subunit [Caulobacter segnis]